MITGVCISISSIIIEGLGVLRAPVDEGGVDQRQAVAGVGSMAMCSWARTSAREVEIRSKAEARLARNSSCAPSPVCASETPRSVATTSGGGGTYPPPWPASHPQHPQSHPQSLVFACFFLIRELLHGSRRPQGAGGSSTRRQCTSRFRGSGAPAGRLAKPRRLHAAARRPGAWPSPASRRLARPRRTGEDPQRNRSSWLPPGARHSPRRPEARRA